jgi:hypothetical protein
MILSIIITISPTLHLGWCPGSEFMFPILQRRQIDIKPRRTHLRPSPMVS